MQLTDRERLMRAVTFLFLLQLNSGPHPGLILARSKSIGVAYEGGGERIHTENSA